MTDHSYKESFSYTHNNPYHDKLEEFSNFVLRDKEAEELKGKWSKEVFNREAPLHLEIGTGYGHFMMDYCLDHPDTNFVGLDYRFKRSFNLARKLKLHPHKNFRYLRAKGERVEFLFEENELDAIYYFFPDPWPKNTQKKKRLFKEDFLASAFKTLKPNGKMFIKTDHEDYANWMKKKIDETTLYDLDFETWDLHNSGVDNILTKYTTKFEKIFLSQDINIKGFILSPRKGQ